MKRRGITIFDAGMLWSALLVLLLKGKAWSWVAVPHVPAWRSPENFIPPSTVPHSLPRAPHSFKLSPPITLPRHPPPALPQAILSSLATLLDPISLLFSKGEDRVGAAGESGENEGYSTATTAQPPPFVYFPEGHGKCQDFAPAGFNVYSFLSFMFAVANLVGLVANNVNNNLNNDNNNNNNNNNNLDNINLADSNSNINNDNTVDIPAAKSNQRRRRRRQRRTQWVKENVVKEETGTEVSLVAMDFIKSLRTAMVVSDSACSLRNMCEVNRAATGRGETGRVLAEVLSLALVEWYPRHPPPAGATALLFAARTGRSRKECSATHPDCSDATWHHLTDDPTEDTLTETLTMALTSDGLEGFPDLASLIHLSPVPSPCNTSWNNDKETL
ncbi:uncharacterized protein LOC123500010 isoform X2 [Portunus trituberculatus]|uniref:uncharacterized protein LOC123500010 isoform X2 n=1 Tax=Portunus trituberculatus TaxID=210409 RepID=UPI001E1D2165|nr:uncharacterized protein LOC123500010 isoform X2 [Portunus trituberculatus]